MSRSGAGVMGEPPGQTVATPTTGLVESWRSRAQALRPYAPAAAQAFEDAATELENALRTAANTVLTLSQAADYSGLSADHIRRLIRNGALANVGRRYA